MTDPDARALRFLRRLVTVLTATMIVGVMTIVALLVIRLQTPPEPRLPTLPDTIALPSGATAQALTFGDGWIGVVTDDDRFLIYGDDGRLRDEIALPAAD